MIANLEEYFKPEQKFYLEKISYNRSVHENQIIPKAEYTLNCTDNIRIQLNENGIEIFVRRTLKFAPEELFELYVEFGAALDFEPEKKREYEWDKLDLEEEFRKNGEFVMGNLMHRISLLIAEITASYGQPPLILPPVLASEE